MLYVIIGASGTGKSTLFKKLSEIYDNSNLNVYHLPQITTRPIREGEDPDKEYHFVSRNEFFRYGALHSANAAFYNTNLAIPDVFYALPEETRFNCNSTTKFFMTACPALVEDYLIRNARTVLENLHIINLVADYDFLSSRLFERGDTPDEIRRRLKHDMEDMTRLLALIADLKDDNNGGYELHTSYPRRHEIDVGPPHKLDQIVRKARQIIEA